MDVIELEGGFTDAPVQSAHAFRAAMSALARPGRIEPIQGAVAPTPLSEAAATLLLTLCDPETPVHLAGAHDTDALRGWITFHTGAPLVGPGAAMFAVGTWGALTPLDAYRIGTPEYPDRSATLIVEMEGLTTQVATLRGPGIKDTATLSLPDLAAFQRNAALFPLGLDFYFTCGRSLAALPRTTKVS
ncbi:phosphonate C-P lyase system protein PhnH [Pseudooceanicola onchidii]|uniref:phosphonate C-P lyase system protein PhnH n=1 Tax=Pseudooceanicola onchidii TaxID=2562279 RepID=UPI0010A9AF06|nr:phosphonate C-P lyase system protein PhnH [Pseudooceanicola onchidii]